MSRLYSTGFELNSTTTGMEADTFSSVTVSSGTKRTGTYALQANAVASSPFWRHQLLSADSSSGVVYFRFYLYIDSMPSADTQIARIVNASNVQQAIVQLNTTGVLQLRNGSVAQVGSNSAALSTGTWYRIEFSWDPATGATEAKIDGVTFASGTGTTGSWSRVILGCITGNPNANLFFDDVAVNNDGGSFQNSWPGAGSILHLRPNGVGDNNAWTPSAGSNWQNVDEVTPNNDTDYNRCNVATDSIDDYSIDPAQSGGVSGTINVVHVGIRMRGDGSSAYDTLVVRAKKTASGTVSESAGIQPTNTTYFTHALVAPFVYPLTLYQDPDGGTITPSQLDDWQIGIRKSADANGNIRVSAVWLLVEYAPAAAPTSLPILSRRRSNVLLRR